MKRGKHAESLGFQINNMVRDINEHFPAAHIVALRFVDTEYTHMSEGGPEYGQLQIAREIDPALFVAIKGRTPEQIAGTIAYQYAQYLQIATGKNPPSQTLSAAFARHLNGDPAFPNPPAGITEFLAPVKC